MVVGVWHGVSSQGAAVVLSFLFFFPFFLFRIFREQDAPSPRPSHHHTNAFTLQVSDFAEEKETKLDEAQLKEIVSSIGQSTAKEVAAKASITAQLLWTVPKCSPLNAS